MQETLHRLGKAPGELRVDNSSAATHRVGGGGTGREFNEQFTSLCEHYGLVPRTIGIGCPNENGDVESSNGHLKRRMRQHLLLGGSRDFNSEADYEGFLHQVLERGNRGRQENLLVELAVMRPLPPTRLSEYDEVFCTVGSASTIRVKKVGYSVPARLIGQELNVEVYERELKLYSGRELLLVLPRHCEICLEILARAPGIRFPVPYGAFYVFFEATPFFGTWSGGREIRDSVALAAHLLDAHGLAVVPGAAFDDDTGIRVSYTLPEEDLRRGLELLVKVLRARV